MSEKRYAVAIKYPGQEAPQPDTMTASEIISAIDMADCFEPEIFKVYEVTARGNMKPLRIRGKWHKSNDPLYIKVTDNLGKLAFDGYGTDH